MESTVPLTVRLSVDHADLASLERAVGEALGEVRRSLWAHLLSRLEDATAVPHPCPACGGTLKANGRASRRVVTLSGEVEIRRRRYRCRSCAAEVVPLDAALGLAPRLQHSLGVRERALWQVTEQSYARTALTLAELCHVAVSGAQLHAWVGEEGGRIEEAMAADQAAIFERGRTLPPGRHPPTVWVSADGTFVHDRGPGSGFEVKVGLVFEGRRPVGRRRRTLLGRHLAAGTEDWHTFAERFTAACARLGVYEAERICFVGDGAPAIRWLRETYFPGALELLDWYHLEEALRWGIGPQQPVLLEAVLEAARRGKVDRLLDHLGRASEAAHTVDPERAAKLREAASYVSANRRGIENYRIEPLASSGPTEKAVDIVVARRFKLRGMSWYRRGVSALLRLRLLRLNGTWATYWRERFASALRPWPLPARPSTGD